MKARPPAPLACSPAKTNKRVSLVCRFGNSFYLYSGQTIIVSSASSRLSSVPETSGMRRTLHSWPFCAEAATSQRLSRVFVASMWTSLFSVLVLCLLNARFSENERNCKMEGLLCHYKGGGNIFANHWWRFIVQWRNRSYEWLKKIVEYATSLAGWVLLSDILCDCQNFRISCRVEKVVSVTIVK